MLYLGASSGLLRVMKYKQGNNRIIDCSVRSMNSETKTNASLKNPTCTDGVCNLNSSNQHTLRDQSTTLQTLTDVSQNASSVSVSTTEISSDTSIYGPKVDFSFLGVLSTPRSIPLVYLQKH
ncbi:unnamed protein product [Heterobilharzia americana]|nr:unnamed protein product [Heterobilharzia americana]